jgi:hypothetical protein
VTTSIISTQLITRVSGKILIPIGMLISGASMYLLTHIGVDSGYASHVLPALLLLGVGMGLIFAPAFSLATLGVEAADSGVASATVNTMQQVGGSVGTALLNTIATTAATTYASSHLALGNPKVIAAHAAVHSYVVTFWWAAAIFAIGAAVTALVLRPGVPDFASEAAESVVL